MQRYISKFIVALLVFGVVSMLGHAQHRLRRSPRRASTNKQDDVEKANTRKLIRELGKLCKYKSIGVPTENGYNQILSESYDLNQIASAMKVNSNYKVNVYYNGDKIVVSRFFNGVKYNITFENRDGASEFNLDTSNFDGYPSGSVEGGEKCSTPSNALRMKVYRMVDDLPLSASQKAELKRNVRVSKSIKLGLIFL